MNLIHPNRRDVLLAGTSTLLLPAVGGAQQLWATLHLHSVSSPGAVFYLPEVSDNLGIMDCNGLRGLAAAYRAACAGLDDAQLNDIKGRLERLTQQEIYKLQTSVDLQDGKEVAAWMGIFDGIVTATIGAVAIGALIFNAPVVLAGATTTALIYGLGVSPTISIVKTALDDPSGGKILFAWAEGRLGAVALEAASASAGAAGKTALKTLTTAATSSFDVFKGVKAVVEGSSDLSTLDATMKSAANRVLELENGFKPVLADRAALKQMLCATAEASAKSLDQFATTHANADCRPNSLEIQNLQFRESGVIIRA